MMNHPRRLSFDPMPDICFYFCQRGQVEQIFSCGVLPVDVLRV